MNDLESRVLNSIEHDLLRELHKHVDILNDVLKREITEAEFSAMKYKERECYDRLIELKRAFNVLTSFLDVTSNKK